MRRCPMLLVLWLTLLLAPLPLVDAAEPFPELYVDVQPRAVARIEPGVVVGDHVAHGWSDLVTLVHPRLGAGAVDSIPEFAGRYAEMFKFTVLANVKQAPVDGKPQYWLDRMGVGFAMDIDGKMTVLDKSSAQRLGAELGMIERGVLGGNEAVLDDMVQVARTERLIVFDVQTNMLQGGEHRMMVLRHLLWVSPNSGRLGLLVWLLDEPQDTKDPEGDYRVVHQHMQFLPPAYHEDRVIHVSEGGLFSKIPTADRFALESVPAGRAVFFSDTMLRVAGRRTFDREDLQHLVAGVSRSLAEWKRTAKP